MKTYTINAIQEEMTQAGSHWWDKDTMRFFRTRVSEQVYQGPGGIYFVTSEKNGDEPRAYSVRQYQPSRQHVDTIGKFNEMSRDQAHREAKRLASTSLDEQFAQAMCVLDRAVTGDDKSGNVTQYGTVAEARDKCEEGADPICLCDGGHTRLLPGRYEDGSGYYLKLIPTGSEEGQEKAKKAFSDAYELQQEVCRVLGTEPAGETAIVVQEAHRKPTEAEQLAIDIQRGGGRATTLTAGHLIRMATQHQRMMEDECNGVDIYDQDGNPLPELARLRKVIEAAAKDAGCDVKFSGDPRGSTVRLLLPSGESNSWGGEGWCVPTRG
ncbi:MAG: hypothetical protein KJ000_19205 [Pirellulaceae bacterium]|nr:hypothetical protein [Pirellulaceae bacterium]